MDIESEISIEKQIVWQWTHALVNPKIRFDALIQLCSRRVAFTELAPEIWLESDTALTFLREIFESYAAVHTATLTMEQSSRVGMVLQLLSYVASNPASRRLLLREYIPLYIYPFLRITTYTSACECLKMVSLRVLAALVLTGDKESIAFLLATAAIPHCLRIMHSSSNECKFLATFVVEQIMMSEIGLGFICETYMRFAHLAAALQNMTEKLTVCPNPELLYHVVRCYLRLSENEKARTALRLCLPEQLRDVTFFGVVREGELTGLFLELLNQNLETGNKVESQSNTRMLCIADSYHANTTVNRA